MPKRSTDGSASSDGKMRAKGPVLGYMISIKNSALGISIIDSPYRVLEEVNRRGLKFTDVADHKKTEIKASRAHKEGPDLSFSGGQHADATFGILAAFEKMDLARAEFILNQNPDLLSSGDDAITVPLTVAVASGNVSAVRFLISRKIDLDYETELGMTALHWAAALGEQEIVEMLLTAGADGIRLNWFYVTPGELAVLNGEKETTHSISRYVREPVGEVSPQQVLVRMKEHGEEVP